ncbi:hypothetical protein CAPTEDRAFT_201536 [Capitella teleta]|uniref:Uncharacterized protein n=1 Tax=Capitella teleta TaxID=283909 RepID=R7UW67_CAPTE|nr:hypothetical protein CAPTEDRAFT_201536 [Capitella teleta]|eukprot:ELU07601.1 hypothetical protein CAPTEDRAFT_201536 [Capitella teleta]
MLGISVFSGHIEKKRQRGDEELEFRTYVVIDQLVATSVLGGLLKDKAVTGYGAFQGLKETSGSTGEEPLLEDWVTDDKGEVSRDPRDKLDWEGADTGDMEGEEASDELLVETELIGECADQHVSTDGSANFIPLSFIIPANSATLNDKLHRGSANVQQVQPHVDAKSIMEHLDWDTNRMEMLGLVDYDK